MKAPAVCLLLLYMYSTLDEAHTSRAHAHRRLYVYGTIRYLMDGLLADWLAGCSMLLCERVVHESRLVNVNVSESSMWYES